MKYLSSLVIFSCLFLSSTFSQVKKQYVDADNSSTTVVVKEDNASDIDILNANFDINAFGLGEVIMIKTEKEPKVVQKEVTEPKVKVTTPKETPEKLVVQEVTKPARNVAAMPVARSKSVGGSSVKSSSRATSTKAKKYKKKKRAKRYKNKKFKKKRKKRRVLCPSF